MDELRRDTRYATRRLARDWRFTLLAVLILALGIGANTAMFSVINALFRPQLPYPEAHRLVNLYQNDADTGLPGFFGHLVSGLRGHGRLHGPLFRRDGQHGPLPGSSLPR